MDNQSKYNLECYICQREIDIRKDLHFKFRYMSKYCIMCFGCFWGDIVLKANKYYYRRS